MWGMKTTTVPVIIGAFKLAKKGTKTTSARSQAILE